MRKVEEIVTELFGNMEWHDAGEMPPYEDRNNMQEVAYLCLIDWEYFNENLTSMKPYFEVCFPSGDLWVSNDDLGLTGPVKCVRAWAKI